LEAAVHYILQATYGVGGWPATLKQKLHLGLEECCAVMLAGNIKTKATFSFRRMSYCEV
jgi:hypothetical protein